jgi:hypothetical protein
MFKKFLKLISIDDITMLSNIHKEIFINQNNKSNYYEFRGFELDNFSNFVNNLDSNSLYNVIPMISSKGNPQDPYIVLSRSILVSKYSNYR